MPKDTRTSIRLTPRRPRWRPRRALHQERGTVDLGGVLPTRQQDLKAIKSKLKDDVAAALKHNPKGVAFVTNQELKLAERKELCALGGDLKIDLFHLYRVATILDRSQMAQIRQQYLRIGAGRPPVRVKAEVIGAARVFTSDDELFERFVAIYEKDTREESDKGWAIVKAEEEKKARAEAAKVRAEAEKARAEALQARDKNMPISLAELAQASMPSSFQNIAAGFNIQDVMPKFDFPKYEPVAATLLAGGRYGVSNEPPPPPKALSDEEITRRWQTTVPSSKRGGKPARSISRRRHGRVSSSASTMSRASSRTSRWY